MKSRPACCSSANRSTERPPPRPPPPPAGAPKVIDPVRPTEKEFHVLPEKGKEKAVNVAWLSVISFPKSESHSSATHSARYCDPSGVKRSVRRPRSKRLDFPRTPSSRVITISLS